MLLRAGRLGEATVLGTDVDGDGNAMLSYSYTIGGVDYQAFQRLDAEQLCAKTITRLALESCSDTTLADLSIHLWFELIIRTW